MPQLALNKTSLTRETRQLDTYQRFLPSLDLKRRQLIADTAGAIVRDEGGVTNCGCRDT